MPLCRKKPAAKTGRTKVRAQGFFGKHHYVWPADLDAVESRLEEEARHRQWNTSPLNVSRQVLNRYTSTVETILKEEFNYDDQYGVGCGSQRRSVSGAVLQSHCATMAVKRTKARQPVAPKESLASSLKGKPDGNDGAKQVILPSETVGPPAAEAASKRHRNMNSSGSAAASGAESVQDAGGGSSEVSGTRSISKKTPQRRMNSKPNPMGGSF